MCPEVSNAGLHYKQISIRWLSYSEYAKYPDQDKKIYWLKLRNAVAKFETDTQRSLKTKLPRKFAGAESPWILFADLLLPKSHADTLAFCVIGGVRRALVNKDSRKLCPTYGRSCNGKGENSFLCGVIYNNACIERLPVSDLSARCVSAAGDQLPDERAYNEKLADIKMIVEDCKADRYDSRFKTQCQNFVSRVDAIQKNPIPPQAGATNEIEVVKSGPESTQDADGYREGEAQSTDLELEHAPAPSQARIQTEHEEFRDAAGIKWKIVVETVKGGDPQPIFFLPHSDEKDAHKAAIEYLKRVKRGTVVSLDCGGSRYCSNIDPNRYFGYCDKDRGTTGNGMRSFREKVFSYFNGQNVMITLHNGKGCDGGSVICTRNPYPGANVIYRKNSSRPGDVVIFNGPGTRPTGDKGEFSHCLSQNNINQFYESAGRVADCSMSEAATRQNRPYFNIDYQRGLGINAQLNAIQVGVQCAERQGWLTDQGRRLASETAGADR